MKRETNQQLYKERKTVGGCGEASAFIKMDIAIILTSSDLMTNLMSKVSLIVGLSGIVSQRTEWRQERGGL